MTLQELLYPFDVVETSGDLQSEIISITEDSRVAGPGAVFVAIQGTQLDGHQFVNQAFAQGAAAVVVEDGCFQDSVVAEAWVGSSLIRVKNSRKTLGLMASQLHGNPSCKLKMIGVTGTNGKTTVTHLAQSLLETQGHQVGLLGTVGYVVGKELRVASHTTPAPVQLQEMLGEMVRVGSDVGVLEVSSHALELDRVAGCEFDIVVFTNLTQDHLDFHQTMERYFQSKLHLFTDYVAAGQKAGPKRAVVNADDPWASKILEHCPIPVWTFGIHSHADIQAENVQLEMDGTQFMVNSPLGSMTITSQLVGEHNVSNMLAAIGIGLEMGMSPASIEQAITAVANVPGRFERIEEGQGFTVVVDYAHTDDALQRLLEAGQSIKRGKIITVFGCGGDRDPGKRSKMGQVAVKKSDLVIVTSDNPRTEDPQAILADIQEGIEALPAEKRCSFQVILDRAEAIQVAINVACSGDIVLIAGKGHEDYQILGTEKVHFDDREEARKSIRLRHRSHEVGH